MKGTESVPVCITGMHRSGTSMVARLLNLCGLYLGKEGDLTNTAPDNPEGYWENVRFVRINQALLEDWGGAWDVPPVPPEAWEQQASVIILRDQALQLVQEFADCPRWGWKDPRTSLTLPFWQELLPGLKVIVCVRNPLEVARSLYRRGYSSTTFSFRLWQMYNERLIAATTPEQRLVTHHDSYFDDSEAELRRVVGWLGWRVPDETIGQAGATISTPLRHYRATAAQLRSAGISAEGLALYERLCADAGPVYQQAVSNVAGRRIRTRVPSPAAAEPETLGMHQLIEQQEQQIDMLEQEQQQLQKAFQEQTRWARELETIAREQQATIHAFQRALGPLLPLARAARALKARFSAHW